VTPQWRSVCTTSALWSNAQYMSAACEHAWHVSRHKNTQQKDVTDTVGICMRVTSCDWPICVCNLVLDDNWPSHGFSTCVPRHTELIYFSQYFFSSNRPAYCCFVKYLLPYYVCYFLFCFESCHFKFNIYLFMVIMSQDSVVSVAVSRLEADRSGVRIPAGARDFIFPKCPDWLFSPPSLLFNGYRGLFPGDTADGVWGWPLLSSAQVKSYWSHTSIKPSFQNEKKNQRWILHCTNYQTDSLWRFHVL
jgi:hypothetical protein